MQTGFLSEVLGYNTGTATIDVTLAVMWVALADADQRARHFAAAAGRDRNLPAPHSVQAGLRGRQRRAPLAAVQ